VRRKRKERRNRNVDGRPTEGGGKTLTSKNQRERGRRGEGGPHQIKSEFTDLRGKINREKKCRSLFVEGFEQKKGKRLVQTEEWDVCLGVACPEAGCRNGSAKEWKPLECFEKERRSKERKEKKPLPSAISRTNWGGWGKKVPPDCRKMTLLGSRSFEARKTQKEAIP